MSKILSCLAIAALLTTTSLSLPAYADEDDRGFRGFISKIFGDRDDWDDRDRWNDRNDRDDRDRDDDNDDDDDDDGDDD